MRILALISVLILLCPVVFTQEQVQTDTAKNGLLGPCSSKYYTWNVNTQQARFYLDVEVQSTDSTIIPFVASISKVAPSASQPQTPIGQPDGSCITTTCNTAIANPCKLQVACTASTGNWYIIINSNPTQKDVGKFSITPKIIALPTANTTLTFNSSTNFPGTSSGPTELSEYDIVKFLVPPYVAGKRLIIEVTGQAAPDNAFTIFADPKPTAFPDDTSCYSLPVSRIPSNRITIESCQQSSKQVQGEWYLTIKRAVGSAYTLKLSAEVPIVVPFGNADTLFATLNKVDDIRYYTFDGLKRATGNNTLVVVVDNVEYGNVMLGLQYKYLPFQAAEACNAQICDARTVSCHLTVYSCDLAGLTSDSWVIGVKALALDDPNRPVQFTLKTFIIPVQVQDLPINTPTPGTLQRTLYAQYRFPRPEKKSQWAQIHAYIDATNEDVPLETVMYVHTQPNVGSGGCYAYTPPFTCNLEESSDDKKSCSIQLDPCELSQFTDYVYVSLYLNDNSQVYWWARDQRDYTIQAFVHDPNDPPYVVLSTQDIEVRNDVVAETETNLYRIDNNLVGTLTVALTVADDPYQGNLASTAGVRLQIVRGAQTQGPSCPCWNTFVNATKDINSAMTDYVQIATCDAQAETLFIAVTGLPNPNNTLNYHYVENQYTLTVRRIRNPTPQVIDLNADTPYTTTMKSGDLYYFRLNFPRSALMSKSLVVKSRAHPSLNLDTSLTAFAGDLQLFACGYTAISSCDIGFNNDGFCAITENCFFTADDDSRTMVVIVRPGAFATFNGDATDIFSVEFSIRSNDPIALTSGVSIASTLEKDLYKQYTFNVDPNLDAGKKNLLVVVYVDAGYQYYDNLPVKLYVNSPSLNRLAGNTTNDACLCHQEVLQNERKIVYIVNACGLQAGMYHFSVITNQPVYDTFPAKYTMTATLQDPIIPIDYEFPKDVAFYQGQVFSYSFDVTADFLASTSTSKVFKARITTTDETTDRVEVFLAKAPPSDLPGAQSTCACYEAPFNCTTDNSGFCEIELGYCQLSVGKWYLTPYITASKDFDNPTTVSTYITRKNTHQTITPITFKQGCGIRPGTVYTVDNKNYMHFSYDAGANGAGLQDRVELHILNVKGGSVNVLFNKDNLAVAPGGCGALPNTFAEGNQDHAIPLTCTNSYNRFSVYGMSNSNNDPVTFSVDGCYTQVTATVDLDGVTQQGQVIAAGTTRYYTITGLSKLVDANLPFIEAILTPAPTGVSVRLSSGTCTPCAGVYAVPKPCDNNGICGPFWNCELPAKYATQTLFLEVINAGGADYNGAVRLVSRNIGTAQTIPVNAATNVVIPASAQDNTGNGFKVIGFTFPPEVAGANGIRTAEVFIPTAVSGNGGSVTSRLLFATIPQPCPEPFEITHGSELTIPVGSRCCATPGLYYMTFRNSDAAAVTLSVNPRVVSKSNITQLSWDSSKNNATSTAPYNVIYNSAATTLTKSQIAQVQVPYPGVTNPYTILRVAITATSTTDRGTWYIEKNKIAGPVDADGCYTNFDSGTIGNAVGDKVSRLTFYSCGPQNLFPADDYWFGFENSNAVDQSVAGFNLALVNVDPTMLTFDQVSPKVFVNYDEYAEFIIDIPPVAYVNRDIIFRVTALINDVTFYVSAAGPAGDATDDLLTNCLSSNVFTAVQVSANSAQERTSSSCTLTAGRYFIGVKGTTINAMSQFTVLVTKNDKQPSIALPANATQLNGGETKTFNYTTPNSLDIRSYISFQTSNLNPTSSKPDLSKWTTNTDCKYYSTEYCNPDALGTTCSAIVYPCMMAPSTAFYFDVTPPSQLTADLTANFVARPTVTTIQPENVVKGNVLEHQLSFYVTSLSVSTLRAGQGATIRLESVSCGEVEVWVNKASPAGKYCNLQNDVPCKTAGCVLTTQRACRNDDWSDDYHITVRGLRQDKSDTPIQFSISVDIDDEYPVFRMMHSNERHPINGIVPRTQVYPNTCAAPANALVTPCCAVPPPQSSYTYIPENVHFVYPVEGAHFFEYQNTITLELLENAQSATLYIDKEDPHYCGTTPNMPTCVVNNLNRTCTVTLDKCLFRGARHIYVWADVQIANQIFLDPRFNTQIPLAFIHNNREQYSITGVSFSDQVKYLQFSLVPGETQYIVVKHPEPAQLATLPNYRFTAEIVSVLGLNSLVQLYENWDTCEYASLVCGNAANCLTQVNNGTQPCAPRTPCGCVDQTIPCEYGVDLNIQSKSYLRVVNNGTAPTVAKIQMKFFETEVLIPDACQLVVAGDQDYYVDSLAIPTPVQHYRFNLQYYQDFSARTMTIPGSDNNTAVLSLNEDALALTGTCADIVTCSTEDSTGCVINYRRAGVPHLSVTGTTSRTRYRLKPELITVKPYSLKNKENKISPSVDLTATCPVPVYTQWYLFPSTQIGASNYMLVELQAVAGTTVWMYRNHITYRWGERSCTTDATGYCYFLVACDLAAVDFYFHVDNQLGPGAPAHTITVTAATATPTPVTLDRTVTVQLQPSTVSVLKLDFTFPTGEDSPLKNLHIDYGVTAADVSVWINRGTWGDASCGVANFNANNSPNPNFVVNTCNIHKPADTFYISFISRTNPLCPRSPFTVTPKFFYDDAIKTSTAAPTSAKGYAGVTTRLKFDVGSLAADDVIYVQLKNIKNGNLTHTVRKGNHIAAQTSGFPCPNSCSEAGVFPYVSWHDVCWHCASYDRVYVDVESVVGPADNFVTFDAAVVKSKWIPLTSTALTVTLDDNAGSTGPEGNLAFYSADLTENQGRRIEIQVTQGQTIKVEFYGQPCDHRNVITTYCYPGMTCTIPLQIEANFGSFEPARAKHSFAPNTAYIVVYGQRSVYTIKELSGTDACSPVTADVAPTCFANTLRKDFVWGNPETFPMKDDRANLRYLDFVQAFSCGGDCQCVDLSDECKNNLRSYACDESFQSCSDQGFGLRVRALLCKEVERTCGKTFDMVGYGHLSCFHSFYLANAAKWVDENGTPTRPPDADIDQTINKVAAGGAPSGVPAPSVDTTTTTGGDGLGPVPDAPPFDPSTGGGGNTTDGTTGNINGTTNGNDTTTGGSSTTAGTTGQTTTNTPSGQSGQNSGSPDSGVTSEGGLGGGAIAGIVIGVLVAIAVIAGLVYYFVIKGGADGAYKNFDQT